MTPPAEGPDAGKRRGSLFRREGVELSGPREAFEALRTAAREAIADAHRRGIEVGSRRVRLSDEAGVLMFDGTLEEAANLEIDGRITLRRSE